MEVGSVEDRTWCGRPLSTASQQDCLLSHHSLTDKMVTSTTPKWWLHKATGVNQATRRIRRRYRSLDKVNMWVLQSLFMHMSIMFCITLLLTNSKLSKVTKSFVWYCCFMCGKLGHLHHQYHHILVVVYWIWVLLLTVVPIVRMQSARVFWEKCHLRQLKGTWDVRPTKDWLQKQEVYL